MQFDEPQTMMPEARAVVDLVARGTPVCNDDMNDLHPDMLSAAAEIYASSIALAEFLHITYVNEEMGFGKIKPINILVDNSTAIAFAKCVTKRSKLRHIDCRQRWVLALRDRSICDLVEVVCYLGFADGTWAAGNRARLTVGQKKNIRAFVRVFVAERSNNPALAGQN